VIYAGAKGYFDKVPVADVQAKEKELLSFIQTEHADMRDKLIEAEALTDEVEDALKSALEAFVSRLDSA
jgi:F-type H+-transporting ATPase subunit alpha